MVLDFCPFGCLLSSFSATFCRFPSFWLPFVSFFGCFLSNSVLLAAFCLLFGCLLGLLLPPQSLKYWFWNLWFWISVLLAAFCLPFRLLFVDFRPFGCLLSSLWLPCWARCSLRSPLNIGFEIYGFGFLSFWLPFVFLFGCFLSISVLLAAFCLPFRLLFVEFPPFGCLLSSLWLPCWARCSFCSPLNIGFEIYGFGFLSFWLPFVFLFGCLLSISVLLAAFCLLFGCLVGLAALSVVP